MINFIFYVTTIFKTTPRNEALELFKMTQDRATNKSMLCQETRGPGAVPPFWFPSSAHCLSHLKDSDNCGFLLPVPTSCLGPPHPD